MKLVVVNSTGPMGSSVIASIVEKFGYQNMPIRDYGLNEYLLGIKELSDPYMKSKIINSIRAISEEIALGGVNMLDRDSDKIALTSKRFIDENLESLENASFSSVVEMYLVLRKFAAKSICYKKLDVRLDKHIEITTDLYRYVSQDICTAYEKEFDDVVFIHMHRDFSGWVESIASQRFSNKKKKYIFVLRWLIRRYKNYEDAIKNASGLHLDFDDIFALNNNTLIKKISKELGGNDGSVEWESEKFDLYGRLTSHNKTFTKADVSGKYLSSITLKLISYFYKKKRVSRLDDAIVYFFYLIDLFRFNFKNKVKLILS